MRAACPRQGIRLPAVVLAAGVAGVCLPPGPLAGQQPVADPPVIEAVPARPGRIMGTVVDQETIAPVAGARVLLIELTSGQVLATTEADSTGAYTLPQVAPGYYRVRVQSVGYLATTGPVNLDGDMELTTALAPDAVSLDPVTVTVDRTESPVLRGFERRRSRGIGAFLTRTDMERSHTQRVTDILGRTTRLRVVTNRYGDGVLLMRGRCRPQLYIDGVAVSNAVSLDLALRPDDVEGVEIYSNSEVPPEYAGAACGAILVWTRVPKRVQGEGSWWKRLALVSVLGGLFLLSH